MSNTQTQPQPTHPYIISEVKVGDIFLMSSNNKTRPYIVFKVGETECQVIGVTSTPNIHNTNIPVSTRYVRISKTTCYSKELTVAYTDYIKRAFVGRVDTGAEVRSAVKEVIKDFSKRLIKI